MDVYLLRRIVLGGTEVVKNARPQKPKISDLSDVNIMLIFKHLGVKEELAGKDLCEASGGFAFAMTCNRHRDIFQRLIRKIDASEPCMRSCGLFRCTCRASHELQLKIWAAGNALRSISLPRINLRWFNSVLLACTSYCPNMTEISFHDNRLLEKITTRCICSRVKVQSISVSNPGRRFLETLERSGMKLRKLILTEVEPELVPAVKNVIIARGSNLEVLLVSALLENIWRNLDGFSALDILCRMLSGTINGILEGRERRGQRVEVYEVSVSSIHKRRFDCGETSTFYPRVETKEKHCSDIDGSSSE